MERKGERKEENNEFLVSWSTRESIGKTGRLLFQKLSWQKLDQIIVHTYLIQTYFVWTKYYSFNVHPFGGECTRYNIVTNYSL